METHKHICLPVMTVWPAGEGCQSVPFPLAGVLMLLPDGAGVATGVTAPPHAAQKVSTYEDYGWLRFQQSSRVEPVGKGCFEGKYNTCMLSVAGGLWRHRECVCVCWVGGGTTHACVQCIWRCMPTTHSGEVMQHTASATPKKNVDHGFGL